MGPAREVSKNMLTVLLVGWKMKVCLAMWLLAVIAACSLRCFAVRVGKSWMAAGCIAFCLQTLILGNTLGQRYLKYRLDYWDPDVPANRDVPRHQAINARAKQGHVDLLFLGDSITQAWETIGVEEWSKRYEPRQAMNAGCGGDCTQHVLWRLDHGNIDNLTPKLVVLLIGTNNLGHSQPSAIARGIEAIVNTLRSQLPSTKILILGVFPRGKHVEDPLRAQTTAINGIVQNFADGDMIHYLDISDRFLTGDGTQDSALFIDGVHLSAKGYQVWGDAMEPTLAELLKSSRPAR